MSSSVTNYQCPACTGPLHFAGGSGKLECEYCGSDFDVAAMETLYADKEQAAAAQVSQWDTSDAGSEWGADEAAKLKAYGCPSCGAEIICDETTVATSCVYCGNPTVVPGQLGGALKPDFVIPFKLDKDAAKTALKAHYKGKLFLPNDFASNNHIDELKSVYAPFWLFDGKADADVIFTATKSDTKTVGEERVTTTEHYRISRKGTVAFEKVPVDGSTKMPDEHMDAIEPYDYKDLTTFSSAYLPGHLADKYDMDAAACAPRADERIRQSAIDSVRGTVTGYSSVKAEYTNIKLTQGKISYALMPVWLLATKWRSESFLFAMNGQTGKLIGDLPVDNGKYWKWFIGLFAAFALPLGLYFFLSAGEPASVNLLGKLLPTVLIPLAIAGIFCAIKKGAMKTAVKQRAARNYIPTNGFKLSGKEDRFLYRTVKREKIASASQSAPTAGGTAAKPAAPATAAKPTAPARPVTPVKPPISSNTSAAKKPNPPAKKP